MLVIVRVHGVPVGYVHVPVTSSGALKRRLAEVIVREHGTGIARRLLRRALDARLPTERVRADALLDAWPEEHGRLPTMTVAVCTHDRTELLRHCLRALADVDYPDLDVVVVDNAPSSDATERLVTSTFPRVRYVREARPGLNWARTRAVLESRGEVVAFTDDDAMPEPGWLRAVGAVFVQNPEAMGVTGLVVPFELQTPAQVMFERYGGFGRGFERRWLRVPRVERRRAALRYGNTGRFGTGTNMAFRRRIFDRIGYFDPALDVGTATEGGGDLEMFFRLLKGGYTLVYEPAATVRHRHRRTYDELRDQIASWGSGMGAHVLRSMEEYRDERLPFAAMGTWLGATWFARRLVASIARQPFPRELLLSEIRGLASAMHRYPLARAAARRIASEHGALAPEPMREHTPAHARPRRVESPVRRVDLAEPLRPLDDDAEHAGVRALVTHRTRIVGSVHVSTDGQPVGVTHLGDAIAGKLLDEWSHIAHGRTVASMRDELPGAIAQRLERSHGPIHTPARARDAAAF